VPEPRRGRRKHANGDMVAVPAGMPQAPDLPGDERERIANFWKEKIQQLQQVTDERIEILRTVGEHPSPLIANLIRSDGALGLPKSIVAKRYNITVGSLEAWYGDDYALGAAEIMSQVMAKGIRTALSDNDPNAAKMITYLLDRRGGEEYRPPAQRVQTEDVTTAPPVIDSSKLTADERAQLRTMLERVANGGEGDDDADAEP